MWDNLGGYVEKIVAAHHRCPKDHHPVPESATGEAPDVEQVAAQAAAAHAENRTRVVRTRQRYEQVQALKAQGKSITTIIRELGLAPGTVRKFYRAESVQELVAPSLAGWPSKLDDYKPYLHQRCNSGCTNILQLHREIVAWGYRGGDGTSTTTWRPSASWLAAAPPAVPTPPKVRHITSWIRRRPENLDADEQLKLKNVLAACPHLDGLSGHVKRFAEMMTGRHGDRLDTWIAAVRADDLPALHTFANGLERDHTAVLAGLTLPHSSGAVESNVNRIKMIKRRMFGRANLDLLRKLSLLG